MNRAKLLKILIYLILFIFCANFLAGKFHWYYSIWWFDMPMHTLGGFWVGLALLYIAPIYLDPIYPFSIKDDSIKSVLKILALVLLIGVGWEVFEALNNYVFKIIPNANLDTISDIFFDLTGGSMAVLYFLSKMRYNEHHE